MNTEQLKSIGRQLSNVAFNWAQRPGHILTSDDCAMLDKLRKQFDAALSQPEQQQDGKPEVCDLCKIDGRCMKRMALCDFTGQKEQPPASAQAMTVKLGDTIHVCVGNDVYECELKEGAGDPNPRFVVFVPRKSLSDEQINTIAAKHVLTFESHTGAVFDHLSFANELLSSNVQPSVNAEVRIETEQPAIIEATPMQEFRRYTPKSEWVPSSLQQKHFVRLSDGSEGWVWFDLSNQPVRGK